MNEQVVLRGRNSYKVGRISQTHSSHNLDWVDIQLDLGFGVRRLATSLSSRPQETSSFCCSNKRNYMANLFFAKWMFDKNWCCDLLGRWLWQVWTEQFPSTRIKVWHIYWSVEWQNESITGTMGWDLNLNLNWRRQ